MVLIWPKCCFDSCAKFSGVPNCGKYRKVLGGAITEVIIHRKCTNSTVVHYFRKHSRTTSGKLSTFVKTCFRVIYATINKYFLFISSTEALYFRGIVLKKEKVANEQIHCFKKSNIEKKISGEIDESSNLLLFMGCFPHASVPFRAKAWSHKAEKGSKIQMHLCWIS